MPTKKLWRRSMALLLMCMMGVYSFAQGLNVKGTVKDQLGDPILGATIVEQGVANNGAVTDIDGNFSINVKTGANLVVTYVGYEPQTVKAQSVVNVVLAENMELMDEVVVMGYGVQKKKLVTGSTINISSEDITKQNSTSPVGALYSSVPGVSITKSNGNPGSEFSIVIRGLNSNAAAAPLYVIDGVAGGDINSLSPSDIESIDILKDAASCAIYGSRAASGVVLVTTKQGQKGKVQISYDAYYAWQKPNFNGVKSVDAKTYISLVDEAFRSNGSAFATPEHFFDYNALMPVQWKQIQDGTFNGTDWLHESVNDDAHTYNHAVNIAGGTDKGSFSLGFSTMEQEGTLGYPKKNYYGRTTVRMNTDYTLLNLKGRDIVRLGENAVLSVYNSNGISQGNIYDNQIHTALTYTPLLPCYNSDGSFYSYEDQKRDGWQQTEGGYNLIEDYSKGQEENKTYRIQSNVWLEVYPIKEVKFRSAFGWNFRNYNKRSYTPAYELSNSRAELYDRVEQNSSVSQNFSWENTLTWNHKFGNHSVDALLGNSIERTGWGMGVNGSRKKTRFNTWNSANLSSSDSDIDSEMVSVGGSNTVPYNSLLSYFGRANYNYKETYLATAIFRADGSCNYSSGHRWGFYPSFSAGWVMTNEDFLESTKEWMDFFKVRGSWGQNGECRVPNFQYTGTISLDAPYDFTMGGTSITTGAFADILPNPELTWETTEQTDLGFDARFLNSRLGVIFDWYNKETKDWIVTPPYMTTLGTGSANTNGGTVMNRGVEIALSWNDHIGDFVYGASVNMGYNKNEVKYLNSLGDVIHGGINVLAQNLDKYNTYEIRVGKPIGYFTGIASEGIFQNQAEIDAWKAADKAFMDGYDKAQPGDVKWIDQNQDGVFNDDDVVEIGNPHPDVTIGFNLNLSWKGIDFSLSGSGAFGHQILQSYRSFANSDVENYTNNFVDRLWTGEGSTNSFPRFTYGKHNNFYCMGYVGDIWAQDADYVKIRTITLGYDFKKLFRKMPLQQCRVYFTGQNLFTFTKYDGMDPEVGYGGGASYTSGIDIGSYPNPKSYMLGASLKF